MTKGAADVSLTVGWNSASVLIYLFFLSLFQVYHSYFWPLEWTVPSRDNNKCYAKVICNLADRVCQERFFPAKRSAFCRRREGMLIFILHALWLTTWLLSLSLFLKYTWDANWIYVIFRSLNWSYLEPRMKLLPSFSRHQWDLESISWLQSTRKSTSKL